MRRQVVLLLVLTAVVVVARALLSKTTEPPAVTAPSFRMTPLAGSTVDEDDCTAPIRELFHHPNASIGIADRHSSDNVSDLPDPTFAHVSLETSAGEWDGEFPRQHLQLTGPEIADLRAAFELPCSFREALNGGYGGRYVEISFGARGLPAITIQSTSEAAAAIDVVLDRLRDRYVSARRSTARATTIKLAGAKPRRYDGLPHYAFTVTPAGVLLDENGTALDELSEPMHVDLVDWASALPSTLVDRDVVRGTLTIAGSTRAIAFDPKLLRREIAQNTVFNELLRWFSSTRPD